MSDCCKDGRSWGLNVGGVTVTKDGRAVAALAPIAVYAEMTVKHVQGVSKALASCEKYQTAAADLAEAAAEVLISLGDEYAIQTGKMFRSDIEELDKVLDELRGK